VQAQDFRKLLSQMPRNASTRVPFRSVTAISLSGFSGSELLLQASLPVTTYPYTENKLAEMTSNLSQSEQR